MKPTRRTILRRLVYMHLREYVRANSETAKAHYDSSEYSRAAWQQTYHYGAIRGCLALAREFGLGVAAERLERRVAQIERALKTRFDKLLRQKYGRA